MIEPRSRTEPRRAVLTVPLPLTEWPAICRAKATRRPDELWVYCGLTPDHDGDHYDRNVGWWRYDEEPAVPPTPESER